MLTTGHDGTVDRYSVIGGGEADDREGHYLMNNLLVLSTTEDTVMGFMTKLSSDTQKY